MSVPIAVASARVVISQNGTLAEVVLHPPDGQSPCDVPVERCLGLAAEAGIRIRPAALKELKEYCKGVPPGRERRVEIAHGTPYRVCELDSRSGRRI